MPLQTSDLFQRANLDLPNINANDLKHLRHIHQLLPAVLYCSTYRDGRWIIEYVSQEIRSIMGYEPEEIIGRGSWQELTEEGSSLYQAIPTEGTAPLRYHLTLKMRCASGEKRTFSDDGVFIYNPQGQLAGSMGVFVDITAQQQAAEAIALEYRRLRNLIKRPVPLFGMVGNSRPMQDVYNRIIKLAASSASVVINGESGTGKELAARAIHELSNRADKPFVAVNCGAISEGLFESEFFGHVRGAFTGAMNERKGYLDQANGGTIFLDEVGEIAPAMQAKLLRALDGYGYLPVGGSTVKTSNFRLIAATNRDLEAMIKEGTMRTDFYFRIKTFHLTLPPLRDRREDVPLLAHYFMNRLSSSRRQVLTLDILERLSRHDWPGNVRELQSVIYRYATFQELGLEEEEDPAPRPAAPPPSAPRPPLNDPAPAADFSPADGGGREELLTALNRNLWNVSRTADHLGLGRATVYRRMKQWGLKRPRPGQGGSPV